MLHVLVGNQRHHLYRSIVIYCIVTDVFLLFMPEIFFQVAPVIYWPELVETCSHAV